MTGAHQQLPTPRSFTCTTFPLPRLYRRRRPATRTLVLAMVFVIALSLLGHDPHLAVMESLALVTGTTALGR